ncbi:hypothetical protein [Chitinophaga sp. sic0106]|uniref:hypothetical protein n=1 Tax=Chitinophaga sp. sic0106 TaxID=2854785 RepID=UPI001C463B7B|nr:hypothetical protein [Chitinophaga sp. sic0106]MBV7531818.1 hypothetical protein [Chitinophaga sp. sic0106]
MNNIVKGLENLKNVDPQVLDKIEYLGLIHRRHSRISLKITEYTDAALTVAVKQEKSPTGKYFTQKELIERIKQQFGEFFPGQKIHVRAVPFAGQKISQVSPEWIEQQMLHYGIKLKDIVAETGLNASQLASVKSGDKPISDVMAAMLWFYFYSKKLEAKA